MTKLAIFDLDGTLINFPFTYLFEETERIISALGHPAVLRKDLESAFSSFDYFRVINYGLKVSWDSEKDFQSKFWNEFNWIDYPKAVVFIDTIQSLKALKDLGYTLAIATARATTLDEITADLEFTGILPFMSGIKTRASHDDDWTDKSLQISSLLRETGAEPKDTIMVGDTPSDLISAQSMGLCASYGVLTGGIEKEILENSSPTKVFSNLEDFSRHIISI